MNNMPIVVMSTEKNDIGFIYEKDSENGIKNQTDGFLGKDGFPYTEVGE